MLNWTDSDESQEQCIDWHEKQACVNGQDCTACDVSEYENSQVLLRVIHVNVNFLFQGSTDLWKQKLWSSLPVRKLSSCPRNKKSEGLFGECAGIILGWGGGGGEGVVYGLREIIRCWSRTVKFTFYT